MNDKLVAEMRTPPPRVIDALRRGDEIKKESEEDQRNKSCIWGADMDWSIAYETLGAMHKKARDAFDELASQWYDHLGYRFGLAAWNRPMSDADWQHEMTRPLD